MAAVLPFWRRPVVICFSLGLVAGIGMEVLYQQSGYCTTNPRATITDGGLPCVPLTHLTLTF